MAEWIEEKVSKCRNYCFKKGKYQKNVECSMIKSERLTDCRTVESRSHENVIAWAIHFLFRYLKYPNGGSGSERRIQKIEILNWMEGVRKPWNIWVYMWKCASLPVWLLHKRSYGKCNRKYNFSVEVYN